MQEENRSTQMLPGASERDQSKREEKPYSIYTKQEKWFLVVMIAFTGLFRCADKKYYFLTCISHTILSPLTTNIYFPAIPTLSVVFHKSTELINLTVSRI